MIKLCLLRAEAEALYHAAIEKLAREREYHLYEAAVCVRLECGMSKTDEDAIARVDEAIMARIKEDGDDFGVQR